MNHLFLLGERGVMGPPGNVTIKEMKYIKDSMKGAKGDCGNQGAQGFTGPRGEHNYLLLH